MTNQYLTKDLGEAVLLITKNQKLIEIKRKNNICWFVFENKEICKKLSNEYFFGEILVNARQFYEAINRLKIEFFLIK